MSKTKKTVEVNEFDQTIAASKSFYEKNKKFIVYGGGGLLAIIIVALLVNQFYINPRNEKANTCLAQAERLFAAGNYEQALTGDSLGTMGFLAVADEFCCTKAANLAQMYAGICYAQTGKYEEAKQMLEKFSDCGDALVSPAALGALGNCYAQLEQNDKAVSTLLKAARKADNNLLSPIFLIQAGQIYESMDQKEKAMDCYQELKDKYKQCPQFTEVDKYIERLK